MIDIDKLDELPFREAVHSRFKPDSDFNSCIRKKYRTERISDKEWKIASDVLKHNVGRSINHAYSNFCYKSTGYNKDFFWRRFKEHRYWNYSDYDIIDGIIVIGEYPWRNKRYSWRNKKRPVKSEYLDPKLVQARAEKRQQEKRNLRFRKLAQRNKQYDFTHEYDKLRHNIRFLTKWYKLNTLESVENYTYAIVKVFLGSLTYIITIELFPNEYIVRGSYLNCGNKRVLIKLLE